MKTQTPLDSLIQNCLVIPYYPNFGHWSKDYIGDCPVLTDIDPYFGRVTTSPAINSETFYIPAHTDKFDKQVWFKGSDGSYRFVLEVPGYGREHVSVEIEDDGIKTLVIKGTKQSSENVGWSFVERYSFPDGTNLNPEGSVTVEHGVLTICFLPLSEPKPKTIKLL